MSDKGNVENVEDKHKKYCTFLKKVEHFSKKLNIYQKKSDINLIKVGHHPKKLNISLKMLDIIQKFRTSSKIVGHHSKIIWTFLKKVGHHPK